MLGYRVTQKVSDLDGVDLVLECSTILLGQLVATVAAHQPWELPKSSQQNPVRDLLGHPVENFSTTSGSGKINVGTPLIE